MLGRSERHANSICRGGVFRVIGISGVKVTIVSCNSPQSNPRVVHINQLKKCVEPIGPPISTPELDREDEEALREAAAEEIIGEPGYSHKAKKQNDVLMEKSGENDEVMGEKNEDLEDAVVRPDNDKEEMGRGGQGRYNLRKGVRFRLPSM